MPASSSSSSSGVAGERVVVSGSVREEIRHRLASPPLLQSRYPTDSASSPHLSSSSSSRQSPHTRRPASDFRSYSPSISTRSTTSTMSSDCDGDMYPTRETNRDINIQNSEPTFLTSSDHVHDLLRNLLDASRRQLCLVSDGVSDTDNRKLRKETEHFVYKYTVDISSDCNSINESQKHSFGGSESKCQIPTTVMAHDESFDSDFMMGCRSLGVGDYIDVNSSCRVIPDFNNHLGGLIHCT